MLYERIEAKFDNGKTYKLLRLAIGDLTYAIGPADDTNTSPTPEKMYACNHVDQKKYNFQNIGSRPKCLKWLESYWLNPLSAGLLMDLSDAVLTPVKPLGQQEEEGMYFEEIQKIRDSLVASIESGEITDVAGLRKHMGMAITVSVYCRDPMLRLASLRAEESKEKEIEYAVIRHMYDRVYREVEGVQTKIKLPRSEPK